MALHPLYAIDVQNTAASSTLPGVHLGLPLVQATVRDALQGFSSHALAGMWAILDEVKSIVTPAAAVPEFPANWHCELSGEALLKTSLLEECAFCREKALGHSTGWFSLNLPTGVRAEYGIYQGAHGNLEVRDNGQGSFFCQYTLEGRVPSHAAETEALETFTVAISDERGNTGTAIIYVDVSDKPLASVTTMGNVVEGAVEAYR